MTTTNTNTTSWLDQVATARLPEGLHTITISSITPDPVKELITVAFTTPEDAAVRTETIMNVTKDGKTYKFLNEFCTNLATRLGTQPLRTLFENAAGIQISAELIHNGSFDRWRFFKSTAIKATATTTSTTVSKPARKRG